MVYEKILLLLFLIIFIIAIYYISKTCYKHNSILEKFSEKQLYNNAKFRDCQVYFTNDKDKCDEDYKSDSNNTCKYKFDDWKELAETTDDSNNVYKYADKIFINNMLNESEFTNIKEETRCFYELSDKDDKTGDDIITIDNITYKYQDFYPFDMDKSICDIGYPTKTELKGKQFYEFVLNTNNHITYIKKVNILPEQNGFNTDNTFTIDQFIEKYGNGLEYESEGKFNIYKVTNFPDINVKVYKFTYNYLCYGTQVINYNIVRSNININYIISLPGGDVTIVAESNGKKIDTNIPGINWDNFKNTNSNAKEDKRKAIINALVARKKILEDELKDKNSELKVNLEKIKQYINDDKVTSEYQLTKYISDNNEKWNQDKFLNQFNSFNYKRHYLTKSSDAIIDNTKVEVSIRIKNNFKEGLKFFKITDNYYDDIIDKVKNVNQIESLHDREGKDIKNFKNLEKLASEKTDEKYSMLFTGYFYAHKTGNYTFGTTSIDSSLIYIDGALVVNNGGKHEAKTVQGNIRLNQGDIRKIDIYYGKNEGWGWYSKNIYYWYYRTRVGKLELFWKFNMGSKIYTSDYDNKTWFYYTDPNINILNNNSKIPRIAGNKKYVNCTDASLTHAMVQDNSGDMYYEFKNTDFIYDVIVNRDINVKILVVGGGGGGGAFGGGGGGGAVLFKQSESIKKNDICTIKIGEGGNGSVIYTNGVNGENGRDSSIKINNQEYIAKGGGGGGTRKPHPYHGVNGNDGGSGGGGSHANSGRQADGGTSNKNSYNGWNSYGNAGGKGRNGTGGGHPNHASGGGGGAGYSGEDALASSRQYRTWPNDGGGGDGGIGIDLTQYFGTNVGHNGWFGGGGGGQTYVNAGREGYGNSYDGISDNKKKYGGGGDGGFNGRGNKKGSNGINGTGGGGGGGKTDNYQSGSGGSGVVILRIINSPRNKLAKCNYYIPPLSEITSYLEKSDVLESKINFEVRNAANPKSLFYSSYIYLKKGYYKFNFDIDRSSHSDLYIKSKIIIYSNTDKTNFISVYTDNLTTKNWVYIPDTNYYIFDISIVYISDSSYTIPFKIKARYTDDENSNKLDFSSTELNIDNYEALKEADKFIDLSYYIYYHDNDYLSGIRDITDRYNNGFNSFLESYYFLNNSFGYIIDYFKLLGITNNEIKRDRNIQKIDKLLEYLDNLNLSTYLDSSKKSTLKKDNLIHNIFTDEINNINDYITYNQYRQEDKYELMGIDNNFNMIDHGPRSLYIETF